MTFRNAQQARVYVAQLAAAAHARSVDVNSDTDMIDITTIADKPRQFIPGQDGSTFSIAGPMDADGSANTTQAVMASIKAASTPTPITFMPLGTDGHAWLMQANETDFAVTAGLTGSVDYTMAAQTTGQTDFNGVILENATTVTVDTDGTAVDNGAATSNGAVFHVHVTAFSGLTSDVITIEGSATGAFAGEETTVATFSSITGVGSERISVTGTVLRHLRVADNVTGTGSITRLVAVARR